MSARYDWAGIHLSPLAEPATLRARRLGWLDVNVRQAREQRRRRWRMAGYVVLGLLAVAAAFWFGAHTAAWYSLVPA